MAPMNVEEEPLRRRIMLLIGPVVEMFTSLHVLADPSHHLANQEWAQTTFATMTLALRDEVAYFGRNFDEWLAISDLAELAGPLTLPVPAFLERLAALPPRQVVGVALVGLGGLDPGENALAKHADASINAARSTAWDEPDAFVARLVSVLRGYWEEIFAVTWEQRRPLLEQRRAQEAARLDAQEPLAWLTTLHDRISYDQEQQELVFHKRPVIRRKLDDVQQLYCLPSSFSAPHLMMGYTSTSLSIFINVPLTLATPDRVPPAVLLVAKALGDETRLRIFKAVLQRPRYTQELAAAMKLAEPTVSRHLKVLREAKLVISYKEGPVVLYAGSLDPVDRLPAAMREYVGFHQIFEEPTRRATARDRPYHDDGPSSW